jgi:hypothetical protein
VNDAEPVLLWVSLDVQLTVVAPNGNVDPLAGVQLTGRAPSIASKAEAANVNAAPVGPVASTFALAGGVTTGGTVSCTVTVNDAAPVLLRVSVAVQFTVVTAMGNVAPLGGVQFTTLLPSTRSVADAEYVNVAPAEFVAASVALAGTVTVGGVVSRTVTVNVACPLLPRLSVALHVTVVGPSGNVVPLTGVQLIATAPSTTSFALAVYVNGAPAALVASTKVFDGTVSAGAVVSLTVTVNEPALLLPRVSVAVHDTVVVAIAKTDPLAGTHDGVIGPSTTSVAVAL